MYLHHPRFGELCGSIPSAAVSLLADDSFDPRRCAGIFAATLDAQWLRPHPDSAHYSSDGLSNSADTGRSACHTNGTRLPATEHQQPLRREPFPALHKAGKSGRNNPISGVSGQTRSSYPGSPKSPFGLPLFGPHCASIPESATTDQHHLRLGPMRPLLTVRKVTGQLGQRDFTERGELSEQKGGNLAERYRSRRLRPTAKSTRGVIPARSEARSGEAQRRQTGWEWASEVVRG